MYVIYCNVCMCDVYLINCIFKSIISSSKLLGRRARCLTFFLFKNSFQTTTMNWKKVIKKGIVSLRIRKYKILLVFKEGKKNYICIWFGLGLSPVGIWKSLTFVTFPLRLSYIRIKAIFYKNNMQICTNWYEHKKSFWLHR